MAVYYPRHALQISAVLESFDGAPTSAADVHTWTCVPRRARLERNDVHTADKLQVEVDFSRYPFDPRLIRSAAVAYWAACTPNGAPIDTRDRVNLRFVGTVDVPETDLGEDQMQVTLEARDYTALLLEPSRKPTRDWQVPLDRSLEDVLRDLLGKLPAGQRDVLTLEHRPAGAAWASVSGGGRAHARLVVDPSKDTLWSVMRRTVEQARGIVFVELDHLVVQEPGVSPGPPLPFVYGENLKTLRMKRNTANLTRPVSIRAYDPVGRSTINAEYPPRTQRPGNGRTSRGQRTQVTIQQTSHAQAATENQTAEEFVIAGNHTPASLEALAERTYRQRAVSEIEGSFTTHEPVVDGRDVMAIRTGDQVSVMIASHVRALFDARKDPGSRQQLLQREGYPEEVARVLVQAWQHLDRTDLPLMVRKATLQIDEDSFQCDVDFQNLLTPLANGEEITMEPVTVTTRRPGSAEQVEHTIRSADAGFADAEARFRAALRTMPVA